MKDWIFTALCEQSFKEHFALPALSDYGTEKVYTYEDVAKEIAKLHILFEECHIGQDDKIALIGKNTSRWCITYLAIVTYGAIAVPILQDFSADNIRHIVEHSDASLLFSSTSIWQDIQPYGPEALRGVISISHSALLYQQEKEHFDQLLQSLDEKFAQRYPQGFTAEDIRYVRLPKDKLTIINYTSGTTGFTKGVMITGDNLVGNLIFARYTMDLRRADKLVSMLPLAHAYGSAFEFLYPLMEGCLVYLLGKTPSPKILIKAFGDVHPRLIIAVPLVLEKIYKNMLLPVIGKKMVRLALKIPGLSDVLYKQIRNKLVNAFGGNFIQVVAGGAPLNSEVEDFLLKIKFPVSVGYGMTECAPLISFSLYTNYISHSVGKVLPCIQVRIDSVDPFHIPGEIQVKGQNVMTGYYKNEKATRDAFTEDGWLKTGDLGTIDKDNNVYIRGRSKNMILSASGQNIYPEEIEAKLDNLPYVIECLVVEQKNRLVALVYPNRDAAQAAGLSKSDLEKIMHQNKETLNGTVASFEKIAEIQLVDSEFEKTPKKSIKRYLYQ
ncbi:MAG: AMP-binding protein [Dysgonamonadaceae bacterium]|jgi:long-chain acyl-CoA synthetase|nr:AMP-binding protein [Dysgonamonadaceae bacterium]